MEPETITEGVTLNINDLDGELYQFTGIYSRVGRQLAEATRKMSIAEVVLKRTEARLKLEVKHEAEVRGQKMTDKVMEATVRNLDQFYDANLALIEATAERDRIRADLNALETKGRHLDVLGRRATAEFRLTSLTPTT